MATRADHRRAKIGWRRSSSRAVVNVDSYRQDPLYPRIVRAVDRLLTRGKVVMPVEVLISMALLDRADLEAWRRGQIAYLERVINCNLTKLSRLLRILRFHAHDLRLVPSVTEYLRWGKGPKRRLRFTKTGDARIEQAYARHFTWPGKRPFHAPRDRLEKCPRREAARAEAVIDESCPDEDGADEDRG